MKYTGVLTLILLGLSAHHANAGSFVINVDDSTDILSITNTFNSSNTFITCDNITETCTSPAGQSNGPNFGVVDASALGTFNFNIFEDAAQTQLSDTLTFTISAHSTGPPIILNFLSIGAYSFQSDVDGLGTLTPLANATNITETGALQTVYSVTGTNGQNSLSIGFTSDVEPTTPEPASVVMMGLGLAAVAALRLRLRTVAR